MPDDVCVATDAQVGIGEVRTFDRHNGGVDVDVEDLPTPRPTPRACCVKADVGIGSLRDRHDVFDDELRPRRDFDFGTDGLDEPGTATRPVRVARTRPRVVAGLGVLALGVLLMLDARGMLDLSFAVLAPVACAAIGSDPAGVRDDPAAMI